MTGRPRRGLSGATPGASERRSPADRLFWSRHANPRSVWSLVLAYPVLVLSIYRRDRPLLAGTLLFAAANPLLFSPPEDDRAWATRVVLGEREWMDEGLWLSWDLLFVLLAAPVHLFTLGSAVRRRPIRTAVGTVVSLVLMLVFFDRMARRYETSAGR